MNGATHRTTDTLTKNIHVYRKICTASRRARASAPIVREFRGCFSLSLSHSLSFSVASEDAHGCEITRSQHELSPRDYRARSSTRREFDSSEKRERPATNAASGGGIEEQGRLAYREIRLTNAVLGGFRCCPHLASRREAMPTTWTGNNVYIPRRRDRWRARVTTILAWPQPRLIYHEKRENTNIGCVWPHEYRRTLRRDDDKLSYQATLSAISDREPRLTDGNAAAPPPLGIPKVTWYGNLVTYARYWLPHVFHFGSHEINVMKISNFSSSENIFLWLISVKANTRIKTVQSQM